MLLDGWSVPLIEGVEHDGGTFSLTLDRRYALTLPVEHVDQVVWFVAQVFACAWGYGSHPDDAFAPGDADTRRAFFERVPHPSLAPKRTVEIVDG